MAEQKKKETRPTKPSEGGGEGAAANPELAKKNPRCLEYILVYGNEQWRFRVGARWEAVRVQPRLRTNNGEMLRAAAEAALGICMLPSFIAAPAIEQGSVEVILRDFPLEEGALHAVMPPGRAVTARVRALVDFLVARFGPEPAWDPCWLAGREAGKR